MIITEDGSPKRREEQTPNERGQVRDGMIEKSTQTDEVDDGFQLESENSDTLAMLC